MFLDIFHLIIWFLDFFLVLALRNFFMSFFFSLNIFFRSIFLFLVFFFIYFYFKVSYRVFEPLPILNLVKKLYCDLSETYLAYLFRNLILYSVEV